MRRGGCGRNSCLTGQRVGLSDSGHRLRGNHPGVAPHLEKRYWYQWYLHSERGRAGLAEHREEFAQILVDRVVADLAVRRLGVRGGAPPTVTNPDFVDVSVHSYRHRYGLVDGDPAYEGQRGTRPRASSADHGADGRRRPDRGHRRRALYGRADHAAHFTDLSRCGILACGHNPPQELPGQFADAIRILTA